jgi:hypothetical protein
MLRKFELIKVKKKWVLRKTLIRCEQFQVRGQDHAEDVWRSLGGLQSGKATFLIDGLPDGSFSNQTPSFGTFWKPLEWKMFISCMTICYTLWPFALL